MNYILYKWYPTLVRQNVNPFSSPCYHLVEISRRSAEVATDKQGMELNIRMTMNWSDFNLTNTRIIFIIIGKVKCELQTCVIVGISDIPPMF